MATFLELAHQADAVITGSADMADRLGFAAAAQAIREQADAFRGKELMVVVAGEARRGKSTLLNALLNETVPLFPVDVNVCTNVVTIVRYGETETIEVYIADAKEKTGCRIERISREQISDYVSEKGNPHNFRQVRMLRASIPNDLLKEGMVFVDTPGVGSLNIEHAETTYGFLPNADLLLFVSDADSGLTESELRFLKRGYQYCKNVLFPLTKKDLNAGYAVIEQDNRKKISETLGIPAADVQIIPVSSLAKLRYLKTGKETMYKNSNYAVFEKTIWTMIARKKGEILLLPYLAAAKEELLKLMDNVAAQYQVLDADQDVARRLMDELNQKTAALEELQEKGANWRSQLSLFFTTLQNDANKEQQRMTVAARGLVDERYGSLETQICSEQNYTQLVCEINDLISQGIVDIREKLSRQVESKFAELQLQMNFAVSVNEDILNKIGFAPQNSLAVTFPPKRKLDTAIKWGRNIGMNSMGGGTIGSILGGFIGLCFGGPVGLAAGIQIGGGIGGLAGGAKGCVDALTQYDQLDVSTVIKALNQHITTSMSDVGASVNNTVAELRVALNDSFERQLRKSTRELKENASQIQRNINLTANEIPKKRALLEGQNEQLKKQMLQYETLERAIEGMSSMAWVQETSSIPVRQQAKPQSEEDRPPYREKDEESGVSYGFL